MNKNLHTFSILNTSTRLGTYLMPPGHRLSLRGAPEQPKLRRGRGSRTAVLSRRRNVRNGRTRVGGRRASCCRRRTHARRWPSGCPSPSSPKGCRSAGVQHLRLAARTKNDPGSHVRRRSTRDLVQRMLLRRAQPPRLQGRRAAQRTAAAASLAGARKSGRQSRNEARVFTATGFVQSLVDLGRPIDRTVQIAAGSELGRWGLLGSI